MPAAIASTDGVAFAAFREVPAWHRLGTVFEGDKSTQEMLEAAHLAGWNPRTELVEVPGRRYLKPQFNVVRDNPVDGGIDVLGTVGKRYKVVSNEQAYAFTAGIIDGHGRWDTAGMLQDGTVFGALEIDRSFVIDPDGAADEVKSYATVRNSFNGASPVTYFTTDVRVVCQNTLDYALKGTKRVYKVRHTGNVGGNLQDARAALEISFQRFDALEAEANALFQTAITNAQFETIVNALDPRPEADAKQTAVTRWTNRRDTIIGTYNAPTNATIRGTAWGALQALLEHNAYYAERRGDTGDLAAAGMLPTVQANADAIHNAVLALV